MEGAGVAGLFRGDLGRAERYIGEAGFPANACRQRPVHSWRATRPACGPGTPFPGMRAGLRSAGALGRTARPLGPSAHEALRDLVDAMEQQEHALPDAHMAAPAEDDAPPPVPPEILEGPPAGEAPEPS